MANDLTASNQISTGMQVALVSARLLHTQLGVKKDFTDWFKQQVTRCGSIEGEDYFASILPQKGENSVGAPSKDWNITYELARTISVLSNTEKGLEIKKALIAKDKAAPLAQAYTQLLLEHQDLKARVAIIEGPTDYFTAQRWAIKTNYKLFKEDYSLLGKKCASVSRRLGVPILFVADAQRGQINTYHISVLEIAFPEYSQEKIAKLAARAEKERNRAIRAENRALKAELKGKN